MFGKTRATTEQAAFLRIANLLIDAQAVIEAASQQVLIPLVDGEPADRHLAAASLQLLGHTNGRLGEINPEVQAVAVALEIPDDMWRKALATHAKNRGY